MATATIELSKGCANISYATLDSLMQAINSLQNHVRALTQEQEKTKLLLQEALGQRAPDHQQPPKRPSARPAADDQLPPTQTVPLTLKVQPPRTQPASFYPDDLHLLPVRRQQGRRPGPTPQELPGRLDQSIEKSRFTSGWRDIEDRWEDDTCSRCDYCGGDCPDSGCVDGEYDEHTYFD
jgi:hypothetical protein